MSRKRADRDLRHGGRQRAHDNGMANGNSDIDAAAKEAVTSPREAASADGEEPFRPGDSHGASHYRPTQVDSDACRTTRAELGILEWFHFGDRDKVERSIDEMHRLGVRHLRTGISWADWHRPDGPAWYDWLIPRLSSEFDVLACFSYTPPSIGIRPTTSSPPRDPLEYGAFVEEAIERLGEHFEWVELWNEPNNLDEYDWTLDPSWELFATMVNEAADRARAKGKRVLLGGVSPIDPNWMRLMSDRGVLDRMDAVGVHAFPFTWEAHWGGWEHALQGIRKVIGDRDIDIWITEVGHSTWAHRTHEQLMCLLDVLHQDVGRVYWYSLEDLRDQRAATSGFHMDEREYHCGLITTEGRPKLLYQLWERYGQQGLHDLHWLADRQLPDGSGHTLVTGGAGFIGTNLTDAMASAGEEVWILDDLSRPGSLQNLQWLRQKHGEKVRFVLGDVRDRHLMRELCGRADAVYHLAAQVAVTTSLDSPAADLEVNLIGTWNILDSLRHLDSPPLLVFASTNKVYGNLSDLEMETLEKRVAPKDPQTRKTGVDETRPLDLHTPYGCSKGSAEQYVLDHARCFGVPAVVLRLSCMYGPHQNGTEDQGWVAHFVRSAIHRDPVTIYGDGRQVRDALHVDDLVAAFAAVRKHPDACIGRAFNVGGGPARTLSLLELRDFLARRGLPLQAQTERPRQGDQLYFVSDTRAFEQATGWRPDTSLEDGLDDLIRWCRDQAKRQETMAPSLMAEVNG